MGFRKWWLAAGTLLLLALVGLCWSVWPWLRALTRPETVERLRRFLDGFGWAGVLVLMGLQGLQVLSALISALPVQLAAGAMYGPLGGLVVCLTGVILGSAAVFLGVKR